MSGTPDILHRILARKAEEVAERRARLDLPEVIARLADLPQPRPFHKRLQQVMAEGRAAVIAEIKRASPSKGLLRDPFHPAQIAQTAPARESRRRPARARRDAPAGRFATAAVVLIGIASVAGYQRFSAGRSEPATVGDVIEQLDEAPAPYACDGRVHCSQMQSCEEADWFARNCPGVKMDGDGDGRACEDECGH